MYHNKYESKLKCRKRFKFLSISMALCLIWWSLQCCHHAGMLSNPHGEMSFSKNLNIYILLSISFSMLAPNLKLHFAARF